MTEKREPVIRVCMMPRDTNGHGTIFGGVILSYIDQAGAVEAYRHVNQKLVTVAIKEVVFHEPVHVGDLVMSEHHHTRSVKVTEAELTFVAIDSDGKPTPLRLEKAQCLIPSDLREPS